jgi:hypothetical protein
MTDNFDICSHFGRKLNDTSALHPVWTQNENKPCRHASEIAIKHLPYCPFKKAVEKS